MNTNERDKRFKDATVFNHDLYKIHLGKRHRKQLVSEWDNFNDFVAGVEADIGLRTSKKQTLRRINVFQPFGPGNIFWYEEKR